MYFLSPDIPAGDAPIILEVKWDAFLPDLIREAVLLPGRRVNAFSKYSRAASASEPVQNCRLRPARCRPFQSGSWHDTRRSL